MLEAELNQRLKLHSRTLTHPAAPVGLTEDESREVRKVGTPRTFDFKPRDHVTLGKDLDLIDFETGGKVSGTGFYFLKNDAVLLDLALQQFAIRKLIAAGFTPIITPDLARNSVLEGIGFTPRGVETQVYSVEDSDLSLVGTAEITLGGMHADELLDEAALPVRYVGLSHCFRTEAGAAGRASKGLYRVHQFTKVEMFAFSTPENSGEIHAQMLSIEEDIFQSLGIPYRVLDICTGDLGGPAYRKFDLEAWMPGRGEHGEYGEVTSTSDCTDYQSRRLNIRYRPAGQKGTRFVHTINGTAIAASSRALIAIMENGQRSDGGIDVPEALKPFVGKDVIVPSRESDPRGQSDRRDCSPQSTQRGRTGQSSRRSPRSEESAISSSSVPSVCSVVDQPIIKPETAGQVLGAPSALDTRPPRADPRRRARRTERLFRRAPSRSGRRADRGPRGRRR